MNYKITKQRQKNTIKKDKFSKLVIKPFLENIHSVHDSLVRESKFKLSLQYFGEKNDADSQKDATLVQY